CWSFSSHAVRRWWNAVDDHGRFATPVGRFDTLRRLDKEKTAEDGCSSAEEPFSAVAAPALTARRGRTSCDNIGSSFKKSDVENPVRHGIDRAAQSLPCR